MRDDLKVVAEVLAASAFLVLIALAVLIVNRIAEANLP